MACSMRPKTKPRTDSLLQTIATVGQFAILGEGVSPGGARGTRTPDPLLAKQVLFQLSYSPKSRRSKGTCGPGTAVGAADAGAGDGWPAASASATGEPAAGPVGRAVSPPSTSPGSWPIPSIRWVALAVRSRSPVW